MSGSQSPAALRCDPFPTRCLPWGTHLVTVPAISAIPAHATQQDKRVDASAYFGPGVGSQLKGNMPNKTDFDGRVVLPRVGFPFSDQSSWKFETSSKFQTISSLQSNWKSYSKQHRLERIVPSDAGCLCQQMTQSWSTNRDLRWVKLFS